MPKQTKPKAAQERPTLEAIKAMPGKFITGQLRGYSPLSIAPPETSPIERAIKPLTLFPFEPPVVIDPRWLDFAPFEQVYNQNPEIVVTRTDEYPTTEDKRRLPDELERIISPRRKALVWELSLTPYEGEGRKQIDGIINVEDHGDGLGGPIPSQSEQMRFLRSDLWPVLQAFSIYEQRNGNRAEVLKKIDHRIEQIRQRVANYRQGEDLDAATDKFGYRIGV